MIRRILLVGCIQAILFVNLTPLIYAKGITVSPSFVQLDLAKENNHVELKYENTTGSAATLTFETKEIRPDTYPSLEFINPNNQNQSESNASWVQYDRDRVTISANSTESIKLSFSQNLSPGGHYAGLIANLSDISDTQKNNAQVTLQGMLVTPIFIRAKEGLREEKVIVSNIETNSYLWSFPYEISILLTNKGNVEVIPFSKLKIQSRDETLISEGIINPESSFLLPSASRRFKSSLQSPAQIVLPGIYTITGKIQTTESEIELKHEIYTLGSWHTYILIALISTILIIIIIIIKLRRNKKPLHYAHL